MLIITRSQYPKTSVGQLVLVRNLDVVNVSITMSRQLHPDAQILGSHQRLAL